MYEINDDDVAEQVLAMPPGVRAAFEELRDVVALVPWRSESAADHHPDGPARFASFSTDRGSGFVYFLILEDQHRVDLLELVWIG